MLNQTLQGWTHVSTQYKYIMYLDSDRSYNLSYAQSVQLLCLVSQEASPHTILIYQRLSTTIKGMSKTDTNGWLFPRAPRGSIDLSYGL